MNLLQTIERLEKLEKNATKGPWHYTDYYIEAEKEPMPKGDLLPTFPIGEMFSNNPYEGDNSNDTEFIAESRNALPALLAALREAHNLITDVARLNFTYVMPRPEMPDKEMHMVVKKDTDQARRAKEFLKKHNLDGGSDE